MFDPRYSVILSNVGSACSDRFMSGGYGQQLSIEEQFERAAEIDSVKGVELIANAHISSKNIELIRENLQRTQLKLVSIIPDHFGQKKWGKGAFSSKDSQIRRDAVAHTKEMIDIAKELDCDLISLWPGQDGYDYYFQADFIEERGWFEEGVKECSRYNKDIKIAIEYKPKEPRTRSFPSNVYSTLLMVNEINEPNCGVTIDFGHALVAYENVAESVAVLKKYGDRLFHIHMNDNYTFWDDDMIVASVHTIQYLEFLYWLEKTEYKGWISMDQYPYREDGKEAVSESIEWLKALNQSINRLGKDVIENLIKKGDATLTSKTLRKLLLGGV